MAEQLWSGIPLVFLMGNTAGYLIALTYYKIHGTGLRDVSSTMTGARRVSDHDEISNCTGTQTIPPKDHHVHQP